ncbi:hypothetical protein [Sphingobacterium sp. T2]|uniref:hypothetical protein n=1 Tax=Sphingobacterium sp. T2 TaxID=1590596 RepID=UPI000ACC85BD|nr:hypothetical protein [Sphingobacterium sp. T2]
MVDNNIATQKNTADCFTIESAVDYAHEAIEKDASITRKKWLLEVLKNYITVNYIFNEHLTNKIEQTALSNISTTRGWYKRENSSPKKIKS